MKLQNNATLLAHKGLKLVTNHVDVEFRYVEFFIPSFVKFVRVDELCQLHIFKALEPVLFS